MRETDIRMLMTVDREIKMFVGIPIYVARVALAYIDWRRQIVRSLLGGRGGARLVTEVLELEKCFKFALEKPNGYSPNWHPLGRLWQSLLACSTDLNMKSRLPHTEPDIVRIIIKTFRFDGKVPSKMHSIRLVRAE
ncbi:hypothetical protein Syun_006606 [Stephania yunnanensis]|uniref:Uncharacterized protein n=1 Tax=Stephania yunnanensis TaxID=152371 RepID=A0AAP0KXW8_9MAGN